MLCTNIMQMSCYSLNLEDCGAFNRMLKAARSCSLIPVKKKIIPILVKSNKYDNDSLVIFHDNVINTSIDANQAMRVQFCSSVVFAALYKLYMAAIFAVQVCLQHYGTPERSQVSSLTSWWLRIV